jgi:hypothetical protein
MSCEHLISARWSRTEGSTVLFLNYCCGLDTRLGSTLAAVLEWLGAGAIARSVEIANKLDCVSHFSIISSRVKTKLKDAIRGSFGKLFGIIFKI